GLASATDGLAITGAFFQGAGQGLAASVDGAISFTGWQPFHTLYEDNPEAAGFSKSVGGFGVQTLATGGAGAGLKALGVGSKIIEATGGLKQWVRLGPSFSKAAGVSTRLSLRWG